MDTRAEIKAFLTSRRGNITPERAGLPNYGAVRRVPGLRREEVAMLAGVSVDYYTRLERGNVAGVSESVLEALARALQLDAAERTHLFDLVRAVRPAQAQAPVRRRTQPRTVRPAVQRVLDAMTGAPAFVRNGRLDTLATNPLARALFSELFDGAENHGNHARFAFLDEASRSFFPDWDAIADQTAAMLRIEAGRDPYDRGLSDLVGQLSTRSEAFRVRWAQGNVRIHDQGEKRFLHPVVGELTLSYESLELTADPGLVLYTYTAEPGTRSAEGLQLLSSWVATLEEEASSSAAESSVDG